MSYTRYTYEQLKTFCTDAFQKFGFTADEATRITDVLLSDVYGIESHGMQRLVRYHKGGTCHGFMAIDPAVFGDVDFSAAKQSSYE